MPASNEPTTAIRTALYSGIVNSMRSRGLNFLKPVKVAVLARLKALAADVHVWSALGAPVAAGQNRGSYVDGALLAGLVVEYRFQLVLGAGFMVHRVRVGGISAIMLTAHYVSDAGFVGRLQFVV